MFDFTQRFKDGELTRKVRPIYRDGRTFLKSVSQGQATWNKILGAVINVDDAKRVAWATPA